MILDSRNKFIAYIKNKLKIKSLKAARNRYKRKICRYIYNQKYTADDLISIMCRMGMTKGSNVLIHSSWDEFYNYLGTPEEFICKILNVIGTEGTLIMPAYPFLRKKDSVFDLRRTPTAAGLLPEVFRTMEGVKRSVNRQHSVCAIGAQSDYLLNDHINSETCWDEHSPYYKLKNVHALVFNLGLGMYHVGTIMHCVESVLWKHNDYFSQFFGKRVEYKYRDFDGKIHTDIFYTSPDDFVKKYTRRGHVRFQKKYFSKDCSMRCRLSNLTINRYDASYVINRMIELGNLGVTYFTEPKSHKR